jgi:hypothetical protein
MSRLVLLSDVEFDLQAARINIPVFGLSIGHRYRTYITGYTPLLRCGRATTSKMNVCCEQNVHRTGRRAFSLGLGLGGPIMGSLLVMPL